MAVSIKNLNIANEKGESVLSSVNTPIITVSGSVRRTINDSPLLRVFIGKRNEYSKNKAFKVDLDADGNFSKTLELNDGAGMYYVFAVLITDANENDILSANFFYKTTKPTIDNFEITNSDSIVVGTAENIYYFNSETKSSVAITFSSNQLDSDLSYFFKVWTSADNEPENGVFFDNTLLASDFDVSLLQNGEYFVYLKVIDSAGNFITKKLRFNISKIKATVDIKYVELNKNNHFLSTVGANNTFQILVSVIAGEKITYAELRLYRSDKLINFKDSNEVTYATLNSQILEQIKHSGVYLLDTIDINNWGLIPGDYEVEIFYKDLFNREAVTSRKTIAIKNNQANFYCEQLDINNFPSLVLDSYTELTFYFEDSFFQLLDKQITVNRYNKTTGFFDKKVNSHNLVFESITNNKYATTLKLYLTDNEVNFDGVNYIYENYEFKLTNDYGDSCGFVVPIVYKPKKNLLELHPDFIVPDGIDFSKNSEGRNIFLNSDLSNDSFIIPKNESELHLKLRVLYDVDFGSYSDFKTANQQLTVEILDSKFYSTFVDNNSILYSLKLTESIKKLSSFSFECFVAETTHDLASSQKTSFYAEFYDYSNFKLAKNKFSVVGNSQKNLINLDSKTTITASGLTLKDYNDYYKQIIFNNELGFYSGSFLKNKTFDCVVSNANGFFSDYHETIEVEFFRELNEFFPDRKISNFVYDNKFDFSLQLPFFGLENELEFYIDTTGFYNLNNINSKGFDFSLFETTDNFIEKALVNFNLNLVGVYEYVFDTPLLIKETTFLNSILFDATVKSISFVFDTINESELKEVVFSYAKNTYEKVKLTDCLVETINGKQVYSIKLNSELNFDSLDTNSFLFFDKEAVNTIDFKNISANNTNNNGSYYFDVFYKYSKCNSYFSFRVFYYKREYIPNFEFNFENSTFFANKFNTVEFVDKSSISFKIDSLKVKNNSVLVLDLATEYFNNLEKNLIKINEFKDDGSENTNCLYFKTAGFYNLDFILTLKDEVTGKIFNYEIKDNRIEVYNNSTPFDLKVKKCFFNNLVDLQTTHLSFYVFENYNDNLFSISLVIKDQMQSALTGKTVTGIKANSDFLISDFFTGSLTNGAYEFYFTVTDLKSNYSYNVSIPFEFNNQNYDLEITKESFIGSKVDFKLLLKNSYSGYKKTKINCLLKDTNENIKESFILNGGETDLLSVSLNLSNGANVVSFIIYDDYRKQMVTFDEVLYYESTIPEVENLKINEAYALVNENKKFFSLFDNKKFLFYEATAEVFLCLKLESDFKDDLLVVFDNKETQFASDFLVNDFYKIPASGFKSVNLFLENSNTRVVTESFYLEPFSDFLVIEIENNIVNKEFSLFDNNSFFEIETCSQINNLVKFVDLNNFFKLNGNKTFLQEIKNVSGFELLSDKQKNALCDLSRYLFNSSGFVGTTNLLIKNEILKNILIEVFKMLKLQSYLIPNEFSIAQKEFISKLFNFENYEVFTKLKLEV